MDVFRVSGDFELMTISCSDPSNRGSLDLAINDGVRLPDTRPILFYYSDYASDDPAVLTACLYFGGGGFLVSEDAITAINPLLSSAGYFMDTDLNAEQHYRIFVCERKLDALDLERSEFDRLPSGAIRHVFRYAFHEDRLEGCDVFKIKDMRGSLFVTDRFVSRVNEHKLRGFKFVHVWNSTTGGVRFNPLARKYEAYPGAIEAEGKAKRRAMRETLARDRAERQASERKD